MTPDHIRTEIDRLIAELLSTGLAMDSNPSTVASPERNLRIATWVRYRPTTELAFTTVEEYRWFVENRQYNLILFDGSLLQITYKFRRRELVEHRLCYYPCPFHLDREEWEMYQEMGLGLLDLLEDFSLEEFQGHLRLRSPIRFDFDLQRAGENHPASHLHLGQQHCRIPVFAPLSIGHFIRFVFGNFYPDQWADFLHKWPCERLGRTITAGQGRRLHLNCT
jgi:hypothetical protein